MAQLSIDTINNLLHKKRVKEHVPFLTGLRTGYLRVWFFVAVKVLIISVLLSGYNISGIMIENVALLDSYVRNDFTQYGENLIR